MKQQVVHVVRKSVPFLRVAAVSMGTSIACSVGGKFAAAFYETVADFVIGPWKRAYKKEARRLVEEDAKAAARSDHGSRKSFKKSGGG